MTPRVGGGAAIWREGRLLLLKRLRAPEAGCWSLPGGKVDFGERVVDAVRREVAEETGAQVELTRPLGFVEMIGEGQHWVSPIFEARLVAGEPVNREPDKHEALLWADPAAPPCPLAAAAREALGAGARPNA